MKLSITILKLWFMLTVLMICLCGVVLSFAGFERGFLMMNFQGFVLIWFSVLLLFGSSAMAGLVIKLAFGSFGDEK